MLPRFAALTLLICASAYAEPATVTIHADKAGAAVPASLYGIFFEEINHAGDGGLYAELIQNRSFDETLPIEVTRGSERSHKRHKTNACHDHAPFCALCAFCGHSRPR